MTPLPKRSSAWPPGSALYFVNSPALFGFLRTAPIGGIEDDAVARFQRRCVVGSNHDTGAIDAHNASARHAAMARRPALDHRLMIRAGKKMRAEPARINLFQLRLFGCA